MAEEPVRGRTARNRVRIADFYDALPAPQLDLPSLCAGWDLRTLLGHVVMPVLVGPVRLLSASIRHGSIHRASGAIAAEVATRPVEELTGLLRTRATRATSPPGVGPMGQFVDGCIHLRDAARPVGAEADVPLADWALVLRWLPTPAAVRLGHVPRGLLSGLSWRASDLAWSTGAGPEVTGAAEPLALAMTGRPAVLPELSGTGVALLAARLAPT